MKSCLGKSKKDDEVETQKEITDDIDQDTFCKLNRQAEIVKIRKD